MRTDEIGQFLSSALLSHPLNCQEDEEPYFDPPALGFAAASDPIFSTLKEVVGPQMFSPTEAFEKAHGEKPGEKATVISWSLPIAKVTRKAQRKEEVYPCRRWARTRWFGQMMNDELGKLLVSFLTERGIRAMVPNLLPDFRTVTDPERGLTSTWSERHVAYAAGLGTFSLNDGLITAHGIAHRLGSVVADAYFEPTPRNPDRTGNCLYLTLGKCGKCIDRCPCGAISKKGHDKAKCNDYSYGKVLRDVGEKFGVKVTGCGLCQTDVPCEKGIPKKLLKNED